MKFNKINQSDFDLVKLYIDGSQQGLDTLILRHKDRVYTYIYMIVKNHQLAEDVFQDTFIKVIHSLRMGKYKDTGKFIAWVLRIAHNLVIDHFRKKKQLNALSNDDYEIDIFNSTNFASKTIEEELIQEQVYGSVRELIDYLPEDQKEVIMLRHYMGLSFKDIADQTDVSINTALGRMRYALINMRRLIEDNNINLTS